MMPVCGLAPGIGIIITMRFVTITEFGVARYGITVLNGYSETPDQFGLHYGNTTGELNVTYTSNIPVLSSG